MAFHTIHFPPIVKVGYPSSRDGIWVFKYSADQRTWEEELNRKPYLKLQPDGWEAKFNMILSMDEQCDVLKDFGATFYQNIEECNDLPMTLEEGFESGKHYEKLLEKMDDLDYLDRWLDGKVDCINSE